jgi:magnesium chelatase family protein
VSTVGFPDSTVRESRDRVRAAIHNAGLEFPIDRITVNLTCPPAEGRSGDERKHFMSGS